MMTYAIVAAVILSATPSEEPLVSFKMPPVRVSVPETFDHSQDGTTHHFASKDGEAYVDIDTGKVQTAGMKADVCLGKVTKSLKYKFTKGTYGGQPGAKASFTDKDSAKKEFVTLLYVGCDGNTTWSMSFHVPKAKQSAYQPLATKMAESIEFLKSE